MINRRTLLKYLSTTPLIASGLNINAKTTEHTSLPISTNKISLSQWSFHRAILGNSKNNYAEFIKTLHSEPDEVLQGSLDPRDICRTARILGVSHIDLVNVLFFGHAQDKNWLKEFKNRARDHQVHFQLLMCDETGQLGATSKTVRNKSIEQHLPWLEAAAYLGCKQLRVNAYGEGSYLQQLDQCADSLSQLADAAQQHNLELLVENHGFASNNGAWLAMLIEHTKHSNLGVFTDLDNFFMGGWGLNPPRLYDRIQGLYDLAPYTRGVSAKTHDFDLSGNETTIDYQQCFSIFETHGFNGFYSAEFEGDRMSETQGSEATLALIKKTLSAARAY
ncbi:sugar phosphate isomerase/epimerase family protein [Catenovulum sediminis]|uniref:Sugar phosphate isomerase/epimerase family protein n=1 Tax=Catenovulum sediminis TaxID=1740262 RepID=A0ABV1RCA7_9ALTE